MDQYAANVRRHCWTKLFLQRGMIDINLPIVRIYLYVYDTLYSNTEPVSVRTKRLVVPCVTDIIRFYGNN